MDELTTLGLLESVAVLGLCVAFKEAYNTGTLQVWYPSIDIPFVVLHLKFEEGLSISVLKNRATRHINLQLEIGKFLKKVK
jgi:hypothetical protein